MEKENALKILRELHNKALFSERTALETFIPELKESEDEKTRKRIIALVNAHGQGMYKGEMLAWLENIPYTIDHEKREGFHLGYKAALEKQGESYTKRDVDDAYVEGMAFAKGELENDNPARESIKWLKSLKGRVLPQPKQEWCEEDEHRIKDTIYFLDIAKKHYASTEELDACIDWLKSIRPQNRWKPSKEQMSQLKLIAHQNADNMIGKELMTLYDDLKKLKGE